MSRWRWAALPLCAGLALALLSANARGETFVFQDSERGQRRGKVLVEFPSLLFVAIDGEGPTFLRRAELQAVIDEAGKRHESAPLGTFAAIGKETPAVAVTDVAGSVWLTGAPLALDPQRAEPSDGDHTEPGPKLAPSPAPGQDPSADPSADPFREARPGETALREQESGAEFVSPGAGVRTGDNGVVHGLFPSGAQFWIGVESEVSFAGPSEQVGLGEGELSLETRLSPLQISSARPLALRLAESSYVVIQRAGRVIKLDQHKGRTRIAWPEFSFALHSGQSVALSDLGKGRWTVQADAANDEVIHLMVKGEQETLEAGGERELGTEVVSATSLWRHLASTGELLVRRGEQGSFRPSPLSERSLLSLGPGDALKTSPGGDAALVRQDGARLTLRQGTWIEVGGEAIVVRRGEALVEALGSPVGVETAGGRAAIAQAVVLFKRLGATREAPLEITSVAGRPLFGIGYATLALEARSRVLLSERETPADPPEELEALKSRNRPAARADESVESKGASDRRVATRERAEGPPPSETASSPDSGSPDSGSPEQGPARSEDASEPERSEGPGEVPSPSPRELAPRPVAPLPASTRGRSLPSFRIEVLQGQGELRSGAVEELGNPGFQVALDAGDVLDLRPPSTLKPLGALGLPQERELRFHGPDLEVAIQVAEPPVLGFEGLAAVRLKTGLVVGLNRIGNFPALEFRSGERLLLSELPHSILVENPTIVIEGQEAIVKFLNGIKATLKAAGEHGAQAFVTRADDHLETRKGSSASLQVRNSNVELNLDDGRALWIQPAAPPVDARVGDAAGTLFLSMPGAPSLGLHPDRPLTVLATNEGEFVILDSDRVSLDGLERESGEFRGDGALAESERLLDLLDVPLPDSPSGL